MEENTIQNLKHLEKELMELGLSEKEARAYLALLKLGSQPASVIAKELGLSRSTAQFILEMLVKKQFINKMVRKKILYYTPEPPENLRMVLDVEKNNYLKKHDEKKVKINTLLPKFSEITTSQLIFPKIKYYEGLDGIKQLYMELLDKEKGTACIDSIEEKGEMTELLGDFTNIYIEERVKQSIKNRVISPDDNPVNKTSKKQLMEAKFVDAKKYPLPGDIKVGDKLVCIFDFAKSTPVGISIESETLVMHFKLIFSLLWDNVGKKR